MTLIFQTVFTFVIATIFSPWGSDIFSFFIFLLVYEFIYGLIFKTNIFSRFLIGIFSLLGWVYGRKLMGYNNDDILFYHSEEDD